MLTKTEQDKWIKEATADAVAILKDECLMVAQELYSPGQNALSDAFFSLHDNLLHREKDLRDE